MLTSDDLKKIKNIVKGEIKPLKKEVCNLRTEMNTRFDDVDDKLQIVIGIAHDISKQTTETHEKTYHTFT